MMNTLPHIAGSEAPSTSGIPWRRNRQDAEREQIGPNILAPLTKERIYHETTNFF